MNQVLIIYPKLFNVKTKFFRKLDFFLGNIKNYRLVYLSDCNNLLLDYSCERKIEILQIASYKEPGITHAILFDDGEEFPAELNYFISQDIPVRRVKIPITRVINIDREDPRKYGQNYEYIGRLPHRPKGCPNWSNPYSLFDFPVNEEDEKPTREDVIAKYAYGFEHENLPTNLKKSDTLQLMGKRLGCHCKPYPCHGDVIAAYLNSFDDGK